MNPLELLTRLISMVRQADFSFIRTADYKNLKSGLSSLNTGDKLKALGARMIMLETDLTQRREWIDLFLEIYTYYLQILLSNQKNFQLIQLLLNVGEQMNLVIPGGCIDKFKSICQVRAPPDYIMNQAISIVNGEVQTKAVKNFKLIVTMSPPGFALDSSEINKNLKNEESFIISNDERKSPNSLYLPGTASQVVFKNSRDQIHVFQYPCIEDSEMLFLERAFAYLSSGIIIIFQNDVYRIQSCDDSQISLTCEVDSDILTFVMKQSFEIGCEEYSSIVFKHLRPSQFQIDIRKGKWSIKNNYPDQPMFVSLHSTETKEKISEKLEIQGQQNMKILSYEFKVIIQDAAIIHYSTGKSIKKSR